MLYRSIQVNDYYGTDVMFPTGGSTPNLLQNGVYMKSSSGSENEQRHYYAELSVFGQVFYRQTLLAKTQNTPLIRASEIFCRLDQFARSARLFFELIGYRGFVTFKCSLFGASTLPLGQWEPTESRNQLSTCPDETIGYEGSFLTADWDSECQRVVAAAAQTIGWGYNWDISPTLLEHYYTKNRR